MLSAPFITADVLLKPTVPSFGLRANQRALERCSRAPSREPRAAASDSGAKAYTGKQANFRSGSRLRRRIGDSGGLTSDERSRRLGGVPHLFVADPPRGLEGRGATLRVHRWRVYEGPCGVVFAHASVQPSTVVLRGARNPSQRGWRFAGASPRDARGLREARRAAATWYLRTVRACRGQDARSLASPRKPLAWARESCLRHEFARGLGAARRLERESAPARAPRTPPVPEGARGVRRRGRSRQGRGACPVAVP
jgi:hypothetical protein